jgi:hypothetical protein
MSLIRTTLCWRFLDEISEDETPAEVVRFYESIIREARQAHLRCSATEQRSESDIRKLMVEAIGRSLERDSPTLPSIANEILIQDERWHVILNATSIPHLRAAVVQSRPGSPNENEPRFHLAQQLMDRNLVGYYLTRGNRLCGKTWHIYLHCKIQTLDVLRKAYSMLPFRQKPMLRTPDAVFPELARKLPFKSTVADTPEGIRTFLDECDYAFVAEAGKEGLLSYLQDCSFSPATFLNAQRSIASRIRTFF